MNGKSPRRREKEQTEEEEERRRRRGGEELNIKAAKVALIEMKDSLNLITPEIQT